MQKSQINQWEQIHFFFDCHTTTKPDYCKEKVDDFYYFFFFRGTGIGQWSMNLSNCQYYVKFGVLVDVFYLRIEKCKLLLLSNASLKFSIRAPCLRCMFVCLFVCVCLCLFVCTFAFMDILILSSFAILIMLQRAYPPFLPRNRDLKG